MTEKIGKLSLIAGAIIGILLFVLGIGWINEALPQFDSYSVYFPLLTFLPAATVVVSLLAAWAVAALGRRKREEGAEPAAQGLNTAVFFKAFLYVWTILALGIGLFGLSFHAHDVGNPERMLGFAAMMSGGVWLAALVAGLLIWATFAIWKSNEIVGVIIALVTLGVLGGAGIGLCAAYHEAASIYATDRYETSHDSQYDGETPVAEPGEADDYDYDPDGETTWRKALRFMRARMHFVDETEPVSLLMRWKENGWRTEEFYNLAEDFGGPREFTDCFDSFYDTYDECRADPEKLDGLYENCINEMSDLVLSRSVYRNSGCKTLVKALLLTHDDLYARDEPGEALSEIYAVMRLRVPEADSDDILVSFRYPNLTMYMSEATLEKMKGFGNNGEWCDKFVAVWAYSFWARRHHDGTDGVAYRIVKAIDGMY